MSAATPDATPDKPRNPAADAIRSLQAHHRVRIMQLKEQRETLERELKKVVDEIALQTGALVGYERSVEAVEALGEDKKQPEKKDEATPPAA